MSASPPTSPPAPPMTRTRRRRKPSSSPPLRPSARKPPLLGPGPAQPASSRSRPAAPGRARRRCRLRPGSCRGSAVHASPGLPYPWRCTRPCYGSDESSRTGAREGQAGTGDGSGAAGCPATSTKGPAAAPATVHCGRDPPLPAGGARLLTWMTVTGHPRHRPAFGADALTHRAGSLWRTAKAMRGVPAPICPAAAASRGDTAAGPGSKAGCSRRLYS